jgi:glutamate/tyrosine decarboxylase-like PLP-dependent enzyme
VRQLFGFPEGASGLLVSGTSIATLIGLAVARHHLAGGGRRGRVPPKACVMVVPIPAGGPYRRLRAGRAVRRR